MTSPNDPSQHVFWLASRAFGVVAIVLVSLSVGVGLVLAGRLGRRPGLPAKLKRTHESLALAGLIAIAFHGLLLLGDSYLRPGLIGITVPFALASQPAWTGVGIIGGWLAAIVGLSFYVRRWIGVAVWRWLHRWTLAVYVLAIAHTLGSGTDARSGWLLGLLAVTALPILIAGTLRFLPRPAPRRRPAPT
jgi:sulfoxide reductase heme-binding subunit YedZ